MAQLKPTKTVYTVSNFVDWQRSGSLQLKPIFQRREVWSSKAKSLLIDSVVRGLPMPIVFLRATQDIDTLSTRFEVVDGQQRLRTLFSYIDPTLLKDYEAARDDFAVLPVHNKEISDTPFKKLPADVRAAILGYEISTHVLQHNTADEVVLRIFARLNSTGSKLNHQELRNAAFFGVFKSIAYELAIRNLPLWRRWNVFSDDQFARMVEVETTSDLLGSMLYGIQGKSQPKLDKLYGNLDDEFSGSEVLGSRFQRTMEAIDEILGAHLADSQLRRQALFYSFFTAIYDHMYGLGSKITVRKSPKALPRDLVQRFIALDKRVASGNVPEKVRDAMEKATADKGRRDTRHKFFIGSLGLEPVG